MKSIQAIIVDDVKFIRAELISMLAKYDWISVVGEANNGLQARELIEKTQPDVVFLDICLPKLTGFELLDSINKKFEVIFISSFDKYLPEAQKYDAVDFLMKPINRELLNQAINKLEAVSQKTELNQKEINL